MFSRALIDSIGIILTSRKLFGCFYYPTVLGVPAGLGGFLASFVLADRAVYTYAHGLSTIVTKRILRSSVSMPFQSTSNPFAGLRDISEPRWLSCSERPLDAHIRVHGTECHANAWTTANGQWPFLLDHAAAQAQTRLQRIL